MKKSKPIGYWIAVFDNGEEVKPDMPLPDTCESPFRVVKWIENHPDPDGEKDIQESNE